MVPERHIAFILPSCPRRILFACLEELRNMLPPAPIMHRFDIRSHLANYGVASFICASGLEGWTFQLRYCQHRDSDNHRFEPCPLIFCNSTYCACVVQIFRDFRGKLIFELLEVKVVPKTQARRCTAYEVESLMLSRRPSSFRVVSGGRVRRARNKTRQKTRMRAPTLRLNEQKVGLTNHADLSLLYSPLFSVDRYAENSYQKPHQEENPLS